MKVLLTTQPGIGHLNTLRPLARGLQAAGHEVAFACARSFAPRVEAAGFRAFAAGLDWLLSDAEAAFPELRGMSQEERTAFLTEIFIDVGSQMTYDLLALCREWRPDVILREGCEYGGCVVGECLQIPHALVSIDFFTPDYIAKLVVEEPLAYLRSAYGLPPYPALEMLTRYLYFSYIPPSYHFPEYPLPPVTHPLKPLFLDVPPEARPPEWIGDLADQPTVYISMGTILSVPEVFRAVLEGLRDEPINVIATVGRSFEPEALGPQPDNVRIERFIPYDVTLLPYCNAVITHGGANTTLAALSHALPVLVIPFSGHMLQQALRCKALGVGLCLHPPGLKLDFQRDDSPALSPEAVRQAVRALLTEAAYARQAQALQAEIQALPGIEVAVALLEQLAAERRPLVGGVR